MKVMKWKKLDDFDPPFETKLVIGFKDDSWREAYLESIETRSGGTTYIFKSGENTYDDATHYFIPEPPTKAK